MEEFEYANITTLTAYPRAWHVGASYKKDRRVFLYMGVLTVAVMAALVFYRPLPGLFVFVIAPLFSLWGTAWATYAHHANRSVENHFVACNNVVHRVYNFWTGNLGFHTAHHYKPGVHWSKLPELHAQIADKIPADAYVEPGIPWRWLGKSWFPSRNVADKDDRDAELTSPPTADLTA
jgi:fatty acid desaturase